MKVLATRNVCASGQGLEAGKTYDVSDEDARALILMGKATEAPVIEEAPAWPPVKPKPAPKKAKADVPE